MNIRIRQSDYGKYILKMIAYCGEIPFYKTDLLNGSHVYLLRVLQHMRDDEFVYLAGKGSTKTVRLTSKGYNTLQQIDLTLQYIYNTTTLNGKQLVNIDARKRRNIQVAIITQMLLKSGLNNIIYDPDQIEYIANDIPIICPSRPLKKQIYSVVEKNQDTLFGAYNRIISLCISLGGVYAIYHIGNGIEEWSGKSEDKMVRAICKAEGNKSWIFSNGKKFINGITFSIDSIFIGNNNLSILNVLQPQHKKKIITLDNCFCTTHYIVQDKTGCDMLKIFMQKDWKETILKHMFKPSIRAVPGRYTYFVCDAFFEGRDGQMKYCLSHLDCEIKKLIPFKSGIISNSVNPKDCCILCYDWQLPYLKEYMPEGIQYKAYQTEDIIKYFPSIS